MSKNLEREYQALVNTDAPDLWARIEAGLDEKTTPRTPEKKIYFKVWAGLAAACVCAALIVPTVTSVMRTGSSSGSGMADKGYDNSGAETAADGSVNSVVTSDGAYINPASGMDTGSAGGFAAEAAAEAEPDHFTVTVEILDVDVRMNSGVLYTAKVLASENPNVQADSEIKIFSPAVASEGVTAIEKLETCDLMLMEDDSDDSSQETTYVLVNE